MKIKFSKCHVQMNSENRGFNLIVKYQADHVTLDLPELQLQC